MAREMRRQQRREAEQDAVRFYEPIALGFALQIILLFVMKLFPDAESMLMLPSLLLFVGIPMSAGWRFRMTRRSPHGFLGIRPEFAHNGGIRALSWVVLILMLVGVGSFNGSVIVFNHGLFTLTGLLYPPLALLGGQFATLRLRSVVQKMGTVGRV
jgi:ACR3 family arsenite efflux pump ArsB